jgi:hypothetical protein
VLFAKTCGRGGNDMGYETYIEYGYGINFSDVIVENVGKFRKFLSEFAPELSEKINAEIGEDPTINDYKEFDDFGIAGLVAETLGEYTRLNFIIATDYDGQAFILYSPSYPWELSEREKKLKKEDLNEVFSFIEKISENPVPLPEYQVVENGG